MKSEQERKEFSARLQKALGDAQYPTESPTQLARNFNARSESMVTVHAARKWLVGEAIPTQDKIRLLADWLGVTPEWLRFGGIQTPVLRESQRYAPQNLKIIADIERLDEHGQKLAREFIRMLVRLNPAEVERAAA